MCFDGVRLSGGPCLVLHWAALPWAHGKAKRPRAVSWYAEAEKLARTVTCSRSHNSSDKAVQSHWSRKTPQPLLPLKCKCPSVNFLIYQRGINLPQAWNLQDRHLSAGFTSTASLSVQQICIKSCKLEIKMEMLSFHWAQLWTCPLLQGKQPCPERRLQKRIQKVIWMPPKYSIHGSERTRFLTGRWWQDLTFWRESLLQNHDGD